MRNTVLIISLIVCQLAVHSQHCALSYYRYGSPIVYNVVLNTIKNYRSDRPDYGYTFYPDSIFTTFLTIGKTYPLSVTFRTSSKISIWIDFDNDFDFEPSELILSDSINLPFALTYLSIPNDSSLIGAKRLRIVSANQWPILPCGNFPNIYTGEAEDYIIQITDSLVEPDYCIPIDYSIGTNNSISDLIDDFHLNTILNCNSRADSNRYSVYPDSVSTTELEINKSYDFFIGANSGGGSFVTWIDYNDDLIFSDAEIILEAEGNYAGARVTITIPNDTSLIGKHRLRAQFKDQLSYGLLNPCFGEDPETEDYYISIVPETPDTITPVVNRDWEKIYDWNGYQLGFQMKETYDRGFIIAGENDSSDILLIKTSIDGDTLWTKAIEDDSSTYTGTYGMDVTHDGGVILGGITGKYDDNPGTSFAMKLDACGEQEWVKYFGLPHDGDRIDEIYQVSDSNYVTLASHIGSQVGEEEEITLFKLDQQGNIIWHGNYTHFVQPEARSLLLTSDKGFLITGYAYTSNPNDTSGTAYIRSILIKVDSLSNEQWVTVLGENTFTYSTAFATREFSDGSFITVNNIYDTLVARFRLGVFKTDKNGIVAWTKFLLTDSTMNYLRCSIKTLDNQNSVILARQNDDCDITGYRVAVFIIDSLGNITRSNVFGDLGTSGRSLDITSDNRILICGTKYKTDNYNIFALKLTENLEVDSFYNVDLRYDSLCGSPANIIQNEFSLQKYSVSVFPNPFDNYTLVTINNFDNQSYDASVLDTQGKVVRTYQNNTVNQIRIEKQLLSSGAYILRVRFKNGYCYANKLIVN